MEFYTKSLYNLPYYYYFRYFAAKLYSQGILQLIKTNSHKF